MVYTMIKLFVVFLVSSGILFYSAGSLSGMKGSGWFSPEQRTASDGAQPFPALPTDQKFSNETFNQPLDPGNKREDEQRMVLVNKDNGLPADFIPEDLVEPDVPFSFEGPSPKKWLRKEAAVALERLFAQAEKENVSLVAVSGYRSYETQDSIYRYNVNNQGKEEADRVSARPGYSEHQTGLAMDISSPHAGFQLEQSFGETPEGKWLRDNAYRFGFIIRYPKGKEHITGYMYEPWHIRYVGVEAARVMYMEDLTLEEYVEKYTKHE